jgi:hypothetical protein
VLMEVYGDEVFILKFLSGSKDLKREREWLRASQISKQWWWFFDIQGIVHIDRVPEGQTVNQVY